MKFKIGYVLFRRRSTSKLSRSPSFNLDRDRLVRARKFYQLRLHNCANNKRSWTRSYKNYFGFILRYAKVCSIILA